VRRRSTQSTTGSPALSKSYGILPSVWTPSNADHPARCKVMESAEVFPSRRFSLFHCHRPLVPHSKATTPSMPNQFLLRRLSNVQLTTAYLLARIPKFWLLLLPSEESSTDSAITTSSQKRLFLRITISHQAKV
jgi:hypothetical protein